MTPSWYFYTLYEAGCYEKRVPGEFEDVYEWSVGHKERRMFPDLAESRSVNLFVHRHTGLTRFVVHRQPIPIQ